MSALHYRTPQQHPATTTRPAQPPVAPSAPPTPQIMPVRRPSLPFHCHTTVTPSSRPTSASPPHRRHAAVAQASSQIENRLIRSSARHTSALTTLPNSDTTTPRHQKTSAKPRLSSLGTPGTARHSSKQVQLSSTRQGAHATARTTSQERLAAAKTGLPEKTEQQKSHTLNPNRTPTPHTAQNQT